MIRVGIIGASGYTGAELARILCNHPEVRLTVATSRQYAGKPLATVFPSLLSRVAVVCEDSPPEALVDRADLFFTAVPHQTAMNVVPALLAAGRKVVDLSADFRIHDAAVYEQWYQKHTASEYLAEAVYGLPELHRQAISKVISLLFAAAFYLALKTVGLLLVFVHQLPVGIQTIYAWVRNSGLGEITPMGEGFYRIFFQAHLYAAVAFIFALSFLILRKNSAAEKKYLWLTAVLTSLAVLISLSRSFWLGLLAAVLAMLLILLVSKKLTFIKLTKIVLVMAGMALLEMVFVVLITGNLNQSFFTERFSLNVSEPAAASRLELAGPLWRSVKANWLLGSSFGSEVEYTTLDPRILETNPTGRYTTYAFEWGYLDIWLKIGLLGLLAYLLLLVKMMAGSRRLGSLGPLFIAVLSVLAVTSVFSPYLNHPLGIGLIILIGAMINFYERETD